MNMIFCTDTNSNNNSNNKPTNAKMKSSTNHRLAFDGLTAITRLSLSLWLLLLQLLLLHTNGGHALLQPSTLGVHIVRAPESAVAPKGDEVVFECELNLAPERLDWRFRHATSNNNMTATTTTATSPKRYLRREDGYNITNEERISKLRIYVGHDTLGDYQCVAWFGSAAIASTSAHLTLAAIAIDNANGNGNGNANGNTNVNANTNTNTRNAIRWSLSPKNCLLIRCGSVSSSPPAIWSFYRNGVKIPQTDMLPADGALILNAVSAKDSGNYTCTAMNAITGVEVQLPQRIDVRVDYTERMPPYFLSQPPSQVLARPGETVVLECPGVGTPPPLPVWSSPNSLNAPEERTKTLPYGLQITNVQASDQRTYVCRLDNGIAPALVHYIKLIVLERPQIVHGPMVTLTNEGDALELECEATGNPVPRIRWLINGEDTDADNATRHTERSLIIKHVQKRHAGIVQCFAKNDVGEASEGNLLQVNPNQIQGEAATAPLGNVPIRPHEHTGGRNKGKRKHMKTPNMIPPSRPNVTRLSDDSVMLRWSVSKTGPSLPIQFFKVQYRMVGGSSSRNWQTSNEDIPYSYGKSDKNANNNNNGGDNGIKNFTSSVSGLLPERVYRFRIIAVYSNNDNKEGGISAKFYLQRGTKTNLPAPHLQRVEAVSQTALKLYWTLPGNGLKVDGFYAYYRPSSSAGEYLKATVDGMNVTSYQIDMLEPDNSYEFKLQSFNTLDASEFSAILQGKTKKPVASTTPMPSIKTNEHDSSIYPVVAGATGGGILLVLATLAACLCMKKRKSATSSDEDKPQLDHIQADFVTPSVLGMSTHSKSGHRLNGVLPRMNITPNPLAQEADKNRNVMELRFMPTTTNNVNANANASSGGGITILANECSGTGTRNATGKPNYADVEHAPNERLSSSCETLEACESTTTGMITHTTTTTAAVAAANYNNNANPDESELNAQLAKPLPPLPTKATASKSNTHNNKNNTNKQTLTHAHPSNAKQMPQLNNEQPPERALNHSAGAVGKMPTTTTTSSNEVIFNLPNSSQAHFGNHQQQHLAANTAPTTTPPNNHHHHHHHHHHQLQQHQPGLHHAQPIQPGTPTMLSKRMQTQHAGTPTPPPPVPPHQNHNISNNNNINNNNNNHHLPYQPAPASPLDHHHRRGVASRAYMQYSSAAQSPPSAAAAHDNNTINMDGLPAARLPTSMRTRRSSGSANNNNGGVGIPIIASAGSPCVQRSPMVSRAVLKRNRLGSHSTNDNISSGSLNSIEV